MWECGATRDDRPTDEVVGGRGALWAGAVVALDDVLAFIAVVVVGVLITVGLKQKLLTRQIFPTIFFIKLLGVCTLVVLW